MIGVNHACVNVPHELDNEAPRHFNDVIHPYQPGV